jgi:hypothetical protein
VFIVIKKEVWRQRVVVDAVTPEEARIKAEKGDYEILEDPQYEQDHLEVLWEVVGNCKEEE